MSRKKAHLRNRRPGQPPAPQAGIETAQAKPAKPDGRAKRWQRRGLRLALMVFVPAAVLLLVEGGLRLFGYGYPTAFLLPGKVRGERVFIENERFGWRFFGPALARTPRPMAIPAVKGAGTCRIFVFGESAAYGDPRPDFGLPRVLEALLGERFPGGKFEVINAAMTGINSHVIREIARDCARREGDIWVLYMGNNEVVGPYGSGTVFGARAPRLALIRTALALKRSRLGELLAGLAEGAGRGPARESGWGMGLFVGHQVRHDDARMEAVYGHFARNLADILRLGRAHGVKMVVSTVVSNLRDCAPFASEHRVDLGASQAKQWEQLYQAGCEAEAAGNSARAVELFGSAGRLDDHFADLQFRWGRCCLGLGREEEARRHYVLARDYDTLRFRADSRLRELIRQAAGGREQEGIFLVDSEAALGRESPGGLPGEEWLYEQVHLTFEGNYRVGRGIAEQVARVLPASLGQRRDARPAWAEPEQCARRLGWTEWERCKALQSVMLRLNQAPFTAQLDHAQRCQRLQAQVERLLPAASRGGRAKAIEGYRQALALAPGDWVLQRNLGELLLKAGDVSGAEACCRQVTQLLPHYFMGYLELGLVLVQAGRAQEALTQFEAGLRVEPDSVPLLNGLALALISLGKSQAALGQYERALALKPAAGETHLNLGTLLEASGRKEEARKHFRQALSHTSENPEALLRLGKTAFAQGWVDEALTTLRRAVQLNPTDATAHCWLGVALDAKGKVDEAEGQFAEAVRLDPEQAAARVGLGAELRRRGKEEEAIAQFAEAARLNPKLLEAHVNLGLAWLHQHRHAEARREFEEALRIDANNATAQRWLRALAGEGQPQPVPAR
ncbi:MAG: tetratricopeptide repeat protein [Verrucomicrobiota bacterium]|jgi:tetratricopeptide (TPR) repeat protein